MATINAANAAPNSPRIPTGSGVVERLQTYVTSASLSAGDVIKLTNVKIPLGAQITDIRLQGKSVDGTGIFQIGTDYTGAGAAFGSATMSATTAMKIQTTGLPYNVSVSDDFMPRYVTMTLTVDGATTSLTASLSMTLYVRYTMDP